MRRTVLTVLRGADGRRLAAALASLLLVAAMLGGFHAGAMAAGGRPTFVLCSHSGSDGRGQTPAGEPTDLCCIAGCLAPALAAAPPMLPAPMSAGGIATAVLGTHSPAVDAWSGRHFPRGPPSSV